ncbi:MAG: hypothetical protein ACI85V_001914, partial [bacterium]
MNIERPPYTLDLCDYKETRMKAHLTDMAIKKLTHPPQGQVT